MNKYKVGILGSTGMVGQRFIKLLENHPYFEVVVLAASKKNCGKKYVDAVKHRWLIDGDIPIYSSKLVLYDVNDVENIAKKVDLVFSCLNMDKEDIKFLEEEYAKNEVVVVSNNSAHRWTDDVPMVVPEINPDHLKLIQSQKKRFGTKNGYIVVKPNCSIQSYVPILYSLMEFEPYEVVVSTYQAISGSGNNFDTWPEMISNIIPFIDGEEEKSEKEPLRLFGKVKNGSIDINKDITITSQCLRVSVLNGHTAAVFVKFKNKPDIQEVYDRIENFSGKPQEYNLPSAPKQYIHLLKEEDRPQVSLDVNVENGMAVSVGRFREDNIYDYKFIGLSHNTIRGAAGGAVLIAELLVYENFINRKEKYDI